MIRWQSAYFYHQKLYAANFAGLGSPLSSYVSVLYLNFDVVQYCQN
jgi:hypothetical protein